MQKPFEIFASSAGKADDESLVQGSGGGGPCEAVWWVKLPDQGIMMQWRIKGEAYVVASQDIDAVGEEQTSGVKTVKSELGRRMRVVKEDGVEGWSWAKEIRGHFGNMSPGMRGEFLLFPSSTYYLFGRRCCPNCLQWGCPPTTAGVIVEDVVFCTKREQDHPAQE